MKTTCVGPDIHTVCLEFFHVFIAELSCHPSSVCRPECWTPGELWFCSTYSPGGLPLPLALYSTATPTATSTPTATATALVDSHSHSTPTPTATLTPSALPHPHPLPLARHTGSGTLLHCCCCFLVFPGPGHGSSRLCASAPAGGGAVLSWVPGTTAQLHVVYLGEGLRSPAATVLTTPRHSDAGGAAGQGDLARRGLERD